MDADTEYWMEYRLRDISPQDKLALERFHARLSPDTRYRRYHGAKGDLTRTELTYLTEVDGHEHVALVAEDPQGELHAVARAVADGPGAAELAIVVADDCQHTGVGGALLRSLIERCRREGLEKIILEVQSDNYRALRFFQGLGARQVAHDGGVSTLVIEP